MILAGDIGGTKTILALLSAESGPAGGLRHETRYPSGDYDSFDEILADFLARTGVVPDDACFGVAGPVQDQHCQITNLPWRLSAAAIAEKFAIGRVRLINDLEAVARAVPHLDRADLHTINQGEAEPGGTIAIIAPGTGLGVAFLVWTGSGYRALASEGGHAPFAATSETEIDLLRFLQSRHGQVSYEQVCSGGHLTNIYEFLRRRRGHREPDWLREELAGARDRTRLIVEAALAGRAEICTATLEMFLDVLGTAIAGVIVTMLPRGGVYLGGGLSARLLEWLCRPRFLEDITRKSRVPDLGLSLPVQVILTPRAALFGAALTGLAAAGEN